jgi:hypothetical protein
MKNIVAFAVIAGMIIGLAGCGGSSDETASSASSAPETATETAAAAEPNVPTVSLPDGFPQAAPILPGLVVTESEVLNADMKQYRVKGDSKMDVDQVLDYYVKTFRAGDWEEDSIMAQPANTVCSFIKDGLLVFVDAHTGGIGSRVEIVTGIQD